MDLTVFNKMTDINGLEYYLKPRSSVRDGIGAMPLPTDSFSHASTYQQTGLIPSQRNSLRTSFIADGIINHPYSSTSAIQQQSFAPQSFTQFQQIQPLQPNQSAGNQMMIRSNSISENLPNGNDNLSHQLNSRPMSTSMRNIPLPQYANNGISMDRGQQGRNLSPRPSITQYNVDQNNFQTQPIVLQSQAPNPHLMGLGNFNNSTNNYSNQSFDGQYQSQPQGSSMSSNNLPGFVGNPSYFHGKSMRSIELFNEGTNAAPQNLYPSLNPNTPAVIFDQGTSLSNFQPHQMKIMRDLTLHHDSCYNFLNKRRYITHDTPLTNLESYFLKESRAQYMMAQQIQRNSPNFTRSNRPPIKRTKRYLLVLDIDETLVHSDPIPHGSSPPPGKNFDYMLSFPNPNGTKDLIGVKLRPHLQEFITRMNAKYDLAVYTASLGDYMEEIVKILDPQKNIFVTALHRDHCIRVGNLNIKTMKNFEGHEAILIDNLIYSYAFEMKQGVPISPFVEDMQDVELQDLAAILERLDEYPTLDALLKQLLGLEEFYTFLADPNVQPKQVAPAPPQPRSSQSHRTIPTEMPAENALRSSIIAVPQATPDPNIFQNQNIRGSQFNFNPYPSNYSELSQQQPLQQQQQNNHFQQVFISQPQTVQFNFNVSPMMPEQPHYSQYQNKNFQQQPPTQYGSYTPQNNYLQNSPTQQHLQFGQQQQPSFGQSEQFGAFSNAYPATQPPSLSSYSALQRSASQGPNRYESNYENKREREPKKPSKLQKLMSLFF